MHKRITSPSTTSIALLGIPRNHPCRYHTPPQLLDQWTEAASIDSSYNSYFSWKVSRACNKRVWVPKRRKERLGRWKETPVRFLPDVGGDRERKIIRRMTFENIIESIIFKPMICQALTAKPSKQVNICPFFLMKSNLTPHYNIETRSSN